MMACYRDPCGNGQLGSAAAATYTARRREQVSAGGGEPPGRADGRVRAAGGAAGGGAGGTASLGTHGPVGSVNRCKPHTGGVRGHTSTG